MKSANIEETHCARRALGVLLLAASALLAGCQSESVEECMMRAYSQETLEALYRSENIAARTLGGVLRSRSDPPQSETNQEAPYVRLFVEKALATDSSNRFLAQTLWTHCQYNFKDEISELCADTAQRYLASAPENGIASIAMSEYLYEQGDSEAALDQLRSSVAAPMLDVGWVDQISEFSKALDETIPEMRACGTFSAGAISMVPPLAGLTSMCRAEHKDADWRSACIAVGEALEHRTRTLYPIRLGIALQEIIYELDGDTEGVGAARERKQVLIDSMEQYSETELEILESRASQDEWLRKLKVLGEIGVLQGRTAP